MKSIYFSKLKLPILPLELEFFWELLWRNVLWSTDPGSNAELPYLSIVSSWIVNCFLGTTLERYPFLSIVPIFLSYSILWAVAGANPALESYPVLSKDPNKVLEVDTGLVVNSCWPIVPILWVVTGTNPDPLLWTGPDW